MLLAKVRSDGGAGGSEDVIMVTSSSSGRRRSATLGSRPERRERGARPASVSSVTSTRPGTPLPEGGSTEERLGLLTKKIKVYR